MFNSAALEAAIGMALVYLWQIKEAVGGFLASWARK